MSAAPDHAAARPIRLRRDGMAPLRLTGAPLGRSEGWLPGAAIWHDLGVYRRAPAGFAVEIVARTPAGPWRCHALTADTLDAVATVLEAHDSVRDICPGIASDAVALDDPELPLASLVLQAARLRATQLDVRRRYRIGVGRLLAALAWMDC